MSGNPTASQAVTNNATQTKQFSISRAPEDEEPDYYTLFALVFGLMGVFLKVIKIDPKL